MGIPSDWEYSHIGIWPFRRKIPHAWIVEGTSQIQCLCPACEYGRGYNEAIGVGPLNSKPKVLICKTCNSEFLGVTLGG